MVSSTSLYAKVSSSKEGSSSEVNSRRIKRSKAGVLKSKSKKKSQVANQQFSGYPRRRCQPLPFSDVETMAAS